MNKKNQTLIQQLTEIYIGSTQRERQYLDGYVDGYLTCREFVKGAMKNGNAGENPDDAGKAAG